MSGPERERSEISRTEPLRPGEDVPEGVQIDVLRHPGRLRKPVVEVGPEVINLVTDFRDLYFSVFQKKKINSFMYLFS